MKTIPNLFIGLFFWVMLAGNHYALKITPYPRYVHVGVQQLDSNVTLNVGWKDSRGAIWPLKLNTVKLVPKKYDRWNGHSIGRPWGYSQGTENACLEFQATHVKIITDDNNTTGWLELK